MKIGNNELSESEYKWCQSFSQDILNQATKQLISALNIKTETKNVAVLLTEIWNTPEEKIVPKNIIFSKEKVLETLKKDIIPKVDEI